MIFLHQSESLRGTHETKCIRDPSICCGVLIRPQATNAHALLHSEEFKSHEVQPSLRRRKIPHSHRTIKPCMYTANETENHMVALFGNCPLRIGWKFMIHHALDRCRSAGTTVVIVVTCHDKAELWAFRYCRSCRMRQQAVNANSDRCLQHGATISSYSLSVGPLLRHTESPIASAEMTHTYWVASRRPMRCGMTTARKVPEPDS